MNEFSAEHTDARLRALEDARRFFVQVWKENPGLLDHADEKLVALMQPIWERDRQAKAAAASAA